MNQQANSAAPLLINEWDDVVKKMDKFGIADLVVVQRIGQVLTW